MNTYLLIMDMYMRYKDPNQTKFLKFLLKKEYNRMIKKEYNKNVK